MRRIFFAAVLSFCAFGLQAQSISGSPFIAVHGKAKTEVVPDIFPLSITLKDTSLDTAKTQALIEGYAQQVIALTRSMNMADRDVDVSNLGVSPEYRWDSKENKQIFLGNTYQREIKLRFNTLADLKKMIGALPKASQVQLNTGSFESSKADELRRELVAQAVADARKTAGIMAREVGKRLGAVHNVSNQGFNVRYVEGGDPVIMDSPRAVDVTSFEAAGAPVVLREGRIELQQDVYIIYTLLD